VYKNVVYDFSIGYTFDQKKQHVIVIWNKLDVIKACEDVIKTRGSTGISRNHQTGAAKSTKLWITESHKLLVEGAPIGHEDLANEKLNLLGDPARGEL
jgi:hypothetical protein